MSGSPSGVVAATARYGEAERVLVRLEVVAKRLVDLRDRSICAELGIDPRRVKEDWMAALAREEEPPSWAVSDRARSIDVDGLIDGSRSLPGAWHLVLFGWNVADAASVSVAA